MKTASILHKINIKKRPAHLNLLNLTIALLSKEINEGGCYDP